MKTSSVVRLHALVSIQPEDWEIFLQQLSETKLIVQQEGDDVLTHSCYQQSGTHQCLIVEAYTSEKVFLSHLELARNIAERYPARMTFHRLELAGLYSSETIKLLKAADPKCEVIYFNNHLNA